MEIHTLLETKRTKRLEDGKARLKDGGTRRQEKQQPMERETTGHRDIESRWRRSLDNNTGEHSKRHGRDVRRRKRSTNNNSKYYDCKLGRGTSTNFTGCLSEKEKKRRK